MADELLTAAEVRAMTFMQTVNPWNAHPDGRPRTYEEIRANVIAEARAWALVPETCTAHDGDSIGGVE